MFRKVWPEFKLPKRGKGEVTRVAVCRHAHDSLAPSHILCIVATEDEAVRGGRVLRAIGRVEDRHQNVAGCRRRPGIVKRVELDVRSPVWNRSDVPPTPLVRTAD